jgi:hypothetical protein
MAGTLADEPSLFKRFGLEMARLEARRPPCKNASERDDATRGLRNAEHDNHTEQSEHGHFYFCSLREVERRSRAWRARLMLLTNALDVPKREC